MSASPRSPASMMAQEWCATVGRVWHRRRPGLGSLVGEARVLRKRLAGERGPSAPGASSLTAAELRLLPMLATHLSFAEIAAEMFLSRNTVSSQAMSIYRKLGAGSRSQAVARSRELGLLEG